jgi:cytochrome c biogenesis factor
MKRHKRLAIIVLAFIFLGSLLIAADVLDSISRVQGSTSSLMLLGICIVVALVSMGSLLVLARNRT